MSTTVSRGIWSKFANRSTTLNVKSAALKNALLSPNLPKGPVSLKANASKLKYHSPLGLDKIYPLAYELLEKQSESIYESIAQVDKKAENIKDEAELKKLSQQKQELLAAAEAENSRGCLQFSFCDEFSRQNPTGVQTLPQGAMEILQEDAHNAKAGNPSSHPRYPCDLGA